MKHSVLIAVIVALAVGTYGFRLAGVVMHDRLDLPAPLRRMLPLAAAALLAALAGTAALTESGAFAGVARPLGVAVGAVLAWFKPSSLARSVARSFATSADRASRSGRQASEASADNGAPFVVVVVSAAATAALLRLAGVP